MVPGSKHATGGMNFDRVIRLETRNKFGVRDIVELGLGAEFSTQFYTDCLATPFWVSGGKRDPMKMKITSAATVAFVFCSLLRLCCTDDASPYKRAASSGNQGSVPGATGGDASGAKNSTSGAPPTDKPTNSGTGTHGGQTATNATQNPPHIPNGASSAGTGNESTCDSLHGRLSPSCFNASLAVQQLLMPTNDDAVNSNPDILLTISSTIETYCNSSCIVPLLDYYECTENTAMTEEITGFVCGEFHGQFCPIIIANGILDKRLPVEDLFFACLPSAATACPSDCNSTLSTIISALGCCTPGAVQLGIGEPELYEACALQLPEPCSATAPNATTSSAGAGLHQAAAAVSLLTVFSAFAAGWLF